jgi:hypothetical protein
MTRRLRLWWNAKAIEPSAVVFEAEKPRSEPRLTFVSEFYVGSARMPTRYIRQLQSQGKSGIGLPTS